MRTKDPKIDDLRTMHLFEACSERQLARVASALTESTARAGDVLTREDRRESEQCFLIVDGEAAVTRHGVEIAVVGRGALVGETSILSRGPRTATVTALTPLRTFVFDPNTFWVVVDTIPSVRTRLMRILATRLREADAAAVGAGAGR